MPDRTSALSAEPFRSLLAAWHGRAELLIQMGAEGNARAVRWCIQQFELAVRTWELERLTLEQAAAESGYSYSALEKLVRRGEVDNVGRKGSPRIRRQDLPKKARRRPVAAPVPEIAARVLGFPSVP